jgi:hypothetical protein
MRPRRRRQSSRLPSRSRSTPRARASVYGRDVQLTGSVANGQAGESVTITERQLPAIGGIQPHSVATVQTGANGSFNLTVGPAIRSLYRATAGQATSNTVSVSVRPLLRLRGVGRAFLRRQAGRASAVEPEATHLGRHAPNPLHAVRAGRRPDDHLTRGVPHAVSPTPHEDPRRPDDSPGGAGHRLGAAPLFFLDEHRTRIAPVRDGPVRLRAPITTRNQQGGAAPL